MGDTAVIQRLLKLVLENPNKEGWLILSNIADELGIRGDWIVCDQNSSKHMLEHSARHLYGMVMDKRLMFELLEAMKTRENY